MKLFISALLVLAVTATSSDWKQFQSFKVKYGKTYINHVEEVKRFNIFKDNLRFIEEINAKFEQGLISFYLGVNMYADWTNEEFMDYFNIKPIHHLESDSKNLKQFLIGREQFEAFKVRYGKTYANQEEEEKRFDIFQKNLEIIEENNAKFEQGLVLYQLGVNMYADWTNEEFMDYFNIKPIHLESESEMQVYWAGNNSKLKEKQRKVLDSIFP